MQCENGVLRVVHLKIHFLIRFRSDHNGISRANANIDAVYVGSLRIKNITLLFRVILHCTSGA